MKCDSFTILLRAKFIHIFWLEGELRWREAKGLLFVLRLKQILMIWGRGVRLWRTGGYGCSWPVCIRKFYCYSQALLIRHCHWSAALPPRSQKECHLFQIFWKSWDWTQATTRTTRPRILGQYLEQFLNTTSPVYVFTQPQLVNGWVADKASGYSMLGSWNKWSSSQAYCHRILQLSASSSPSLRWAAYSHTLKNSQYLKFKYALST